MKLLRLRTFSSSDPEPQAKSKTLASRSFLPVAGSWLSSVTIADRMSDTCWGYRTRRPSCPSRRRIGRRDSMLRASIRVSSLAMASQMIALNEAAMDCMKRAAVPGQTPYACEFNLRMAGKLNRAFVLSLEALDRRRGKPPPHPAEVLLGSA